MHAIQSIGPYLGIAAFVGLAILAFVLFQQARDIRRIREWAGRAPERAQEAAEAAQAAAEASRPGAEGEPPPAPEKERGRIAAGWAGARSRVGSWLGAADRRLPVGGRYLVAIAVVAVIAAAVLTSGFGFVGGGGGGDRQQRGGRPKPQVAVLNGTGVSGLAARVASGVVKKQGYRSGAVTNAGSSYANTVVMYAPGRRSDAKSLAKAIKHELGSTPTQQMTPDVRTLAAGAPLALGLGLDDSQFGQG